MKKVILIVSLTIVPLQLQAGITDIYSTTTKSVSDYYQKSWQNIVIHHPKVMLAILGISYAVSKIPWKAVTWSFFEPFYNNMNTTYEKNATGLQDRLNSITPIQPEEESFLSLDFPPAIEAIKNYCQTQSLLSRTKNLLANTFGFVARCSENTPVKVVTLYGQAGAGKNRLINELARQKGVNVYSINLHVKYHQEELGKELLALYTHFHKLGRRVIFKFTDYATPNNFDKSINIVQLLQFLRETSDQFNTISTIILSNRKDELEKEYRAKGLLNGLFWEEYQGIPKDKKEEAINKKLKHCNLKRSESLEDLLQKEAQTYQETPKIINFCQPLATQNDNIIGTVMFKQAHNLQYPVVSNEKK